MSRLATLSTRIPEPARDIRLNLQSVLQDGSLSPAQRLGVAVASAAASRNRTLLDAILTDAREQVEPAVVEDALASAALMAMNNVYYRFRHLSGKPVYAQKPARLRMNRMAQALGPKVDFELFALAVSAINGCEACLKAHEQVVLAGGLTEDQVHDAVRIAATVQAAAVALEIADSLEGVSEAERLSAAAS
jgi:lipoyl-dependent peroxiredoxin subunit D